MPPRLTARRLELLRTLARLERQLGRPPSTAELAAALGVTLPGLAEHLRLLVGFGLLDKGGRYGPYTLTAGGREAIGSGFPVLGDIAAGAPILAEESRDIRAEKLSDVLDLREGDYLLRVRGDSMRGVGIYDGDLIAVRPCEACHNGEIAVVLLPGENSATLKRIYKEGDQVRLVSENPAVGPMVYPAAEVRVQGCLAGHIGAARSRVTLP